MTEKAVLRGLLRGLREARRHNFWILLRTENFVPVGVMTAKKPELDPSKGTTRTWAVGLTPDGRPFKEPLDRWNPSTQSFEPVLFVENDWGIAVTCRRRPEGDEEDNFLYFHNPLDAAEARKLLSDLEAKDRTIASLNRKLEEQTTLVQFWKNEADAKGEELRNLREQVAMLSREVALSRAQVELYKRYAFAAEAFSVQAEATLRKVLETAQEKGEFIGAEVVEQATTVAKKLRELREEMMGVAGAPGRLEEELARLAKEVEELRRKTAQAAAQAAKPAPAEE